VKGAINRIELERHILAWLEEDMPFGDVTTDALLDETIVGSGALIAKESGVLCGIEIFEMIYECIDKNVKIDKKKSDGMNIEPGDVIGEISGPIASILKGERLGLNIMQRLSGIASKSQIYAEAVEQYDTKIVDTRKTTPGLRSLEKYAVRVGGCTNHRYSLSDAVMIKDNHIAGAGSITEAVRRVKACIPHTAKIEVEVETFNELREVIHTGVDIILLDNMTTEQLRRAVRFVKEHAKKAISLEASGNMTLERLPEVAATGVDIISVGALTHSVNALDISLKFEKPVVK
jgi:nicotinate-nucleotide pyrophosphorylase (carboxylating)